MILPRLAAITTTLRRSPWTKPLRVVHRVVDNAWYRVCGQPRRRQFRAYEAGTFWDADFYDAPTADRHTLHRNARPLTAAYHYASLELAVIRGLVDLKRSTVTAFLDLGSGTGHWVDFVRRVFPDCARFVACDVSAKACAHLRTRFQADPRVTVICGRPDAVPPGPPFDFVSLLGCAFHIVDDGELLAVLQGVALVPGGVIVANDRLPWWTHANRFTPDGHAFKVLRSRRRWRTLARAVGLQVVFRRNWAWLHAPGLIPEGHLVILIRPA